MKTSTTASEMKNQGNCRKKMQYAAMKTYTSFMPKPSFTMLRLPKRSRATSQ